MVFIRKNPWWTKSKGFKKEKTKKKDKITLKNMELEFWLKHSSALRSTRAVQDAVER